MKLVLAILVSLWSCGERTTTAVTQAAAPTPPGQTSRLDAIGSPAPLPAAWIEGRSPAEVGGTVGWTAHAWANQFGRFAGVRAIAFSPDGRTAIVAASDSPSRCLRDRACGKSGGWGGGLARFTWRAGDATGTPVERRLADHEERREYRVAASARWLAALDGLDLSVWPVAGDAPAMTATLAAPSLDRIAWAGDRFLVGARSIDAEHGELVVLDRGKAFAVATTIPFDGTLHAMAARPGATEIALAITHYRARATVEVDERKVLVFSVGGDLRASVDTKGYPIAVAWSADGAELQVATGGDDDEPQLLRFAVR